MNAAILRGLLAAFIFIWLNLLFISGGLGAFKAALHLIVAIAIVRWLTQRRTRLEP